MTGPISEILQQAIARHHAGDLPAARTLYERILAAQPAHADALHLLGVTYLQTGDAAAAIGFIERAARRYKRHPGVLANLGQAYFAAGRFDQALATFRRAASLEPDNPQPRMSVANSLAAVGKLAEAEAQLHALSQQFAGHAGIWYNLGNVLRDSGRHPEASECYRRAIALDPQGLDAHNNLGSVLHSMQRFEEAEAAYRACLKLDPESDLARSNLASVLIDLGRFAEAEPICRELIARNPALVDAHLFLGSTLGHRGQLHAALECYRRAAELDPANARAVASVGAMLHDIGRPDEALQWLRRALEIAPQDPELHQILSTTLLAQGVLQEGWRHYVERAPRRRFLQKYPTVAIRVRLEGELRGTSVVLLREQGLGDEIFFLRFAPLLAERGARVLYRCSRKIAGMLSRVPALAEVTDEYAPFPQGDQSLLVGDLPHALGALPAEDARAERPAAAPETAGIPPLSRRAMIRVYWPPVPPPLALSPLPERLDAARRRLADAGPPPYLGVTWRGGVSLQEQRGSSWTLFKEIDLARFGDALAPVTGTLIALQRNPQPGEIDTLAKLIGRPVHDFTALNEDLESMLALLALIDDYVGVSNTNMHLRASVGKTARVLAPCPAEWRWMAAGEESPWFPGFKIYRQTPQGDWSAALARLAQDLSASILRDAARPGIPFDGNDGRWSTPA